MSVKSLRKTLFFMSALAFAREENVETRLTGIDIGRAGIKNQLDKRGKLNCSDIKNKKEQEVCNATNSVIDAFNLEACKFLKSPVKMETACKHSWDESKGPQKVFNSMCEDAVQRLSVDRIVVQEILRNIAINESSYPLTETVVLAAGPGYEQFGSASGVSLIDTNEIRMDAGISLSKAVNKKCNTGREGEQAEKKVYDIFSQKFKDEIVKGVNKGKLFIFSALNNQIPSDPFSKRSTFDADLTQLISSIIVSLKDPVFIFHGRNSDDILVYIQHSADHKLNCKSVHFKGFNLTEIGNEMGGFPYNAGFEVYQDADGELVEDRSNIRTGALVCTKPKPKSKKKKMRKKRKVSNEL